MSLERKPVKGFEDRYYLDPDLMMVINAKTGHQKKVRLDTEGYPEVELWKNNKGYHRNMHKLFAEAYIPNPDNLPEINHKDENKENWNLNNLEWCTHRYNMNYGTINERRGPKISKALTGRPRHPNAGRRPIPVIGTDEDGNECYYPSGKEADRQLGMSLGSVADVLCDRRKTAGGYKWRKASPDEIC